MIVAPMEFQPRGPCLSASHPEGARSIALKAEQKNAIALFQWREHRCVNIVSVLGSETGRIERGSLAPLEGASPGWMVSGG